MNEDARTRKVLAAIDDSAADVPVLLGGQLVASLLGATVEAVHVREDGTEAAEAAARSVGLMLRDLDGPVVKTLIEEAEDDEVVCLVVGARGTPGGPRPAGSTAIELITSVRKPVGVVPPEARVPPTVARMLVPLDGTMRTADALWDLVRQACRDGVEVVIAHVYDETTLPSFSDQPQYEAGEWIAEFLSRYCPSHVVRTELRVGMPGPEILSVAGASDPDVIALGWGQDLSPGRAAVVREVLERGHVPILLIPVGEVRAPPPTSVAHLG
jgi:hypothetical protein